MAELMTPAAVAALFTRKIGEYLRARRASPIAPVVFGVDEVTLEIAKGAYRAVVMLAGHRMAQTGTEPCADCLRFFCRQWEELLEVPDRDRLIEGLAPQGERLKREGATRYRGFRFEAHGAIGAAFVVLRMGRELGLIPAQALALEQVMRTILLWPESALEHVSPLIPVAGGGPVILRREIAAVIRAVHDPVLPAMARGGAHGLRLAARPGLLPEG